MACEIPRGTRFDVAEEALVEPEDEVSAGDGGADCRPSEEAMKGEGNDGLAGDSVVDSGVAEDVDGISGGGRADLDSEDRLASAEARVEAFLGDREGKVARAEPSPP
jgi:hypothetical protein